MNRFIFAATLAACSAMLPPLALAEESPDFAAHFAALQQRAQDRASDQLAAEQGDHSQAAHARLNQADVRNDG